MGVLVLAILAACTKTNPLDCADGTCSDPAKPYCDKDGTVSGTMNACIAVSCPAASAFVDCRGDTAIMCNAAGDGYDLMQCSNGCSAAANGCNTCTPDSSYCTAAGVQHCGSDGAPSTVDACAMGCVDGPPAHCAYVTPRYIPTACDTPATDSLDITTSTTLGTDLDTACTGGVVTQTTQTGARDICIVRNKTITVESAGYLKATGSRLLALVADDSLAIHGTLDASADLGTSGPGGGSYSSGGGAGAINSGYAGGGAGFRTAGAAGATLAADGGAANGGPPSTDPAQLVAMVGGPRAYGGGGGGGVILIACRGAVTIDGTIDLGGGGGIGGYPLASDSMVFGATGGGAGGYLVVQALDVMISGFLYANGGGGGAGYRGTGGLYGNAGQDGSRSITDGAFGGAVQGGGGAGGNGGAGQTPATIGLHPTNGGTGGGGGGGLGFLQTYTPAGVTPTLTPTESSPGFQPNLTLQTQ
jgi:hypothetical protein